jgi:hypothetical protein
MKKFIKKIIVFTLPILLLLLPILISYNVWLDPFGVIRSNMENQLTEPNQNYLKTTYILNNPTKYNAFLFGSSRIGKINVGKVIDDNNWYNMTYSQGVPHEHLNNIELFLKSDVTINKIIIGIDEISCFISPEIHMNQSLRKPYKTALNPLIDYLLLKPSYSMYRSIRKAPHKNFFSFGAYKTIYKNGSFLPNLKDVYIEKNIILHSKDPIFNKPYWPLENSNNIRSTINSIKKIIDISRKNNIELVIFVNPIYAKTYKKAVSEGFLTFLNQCSMITDLYDFSGINAITTNKANYYENSHYRPIIGNLILEEINSTNSKYLVKRNNSSSWLLNKEEEARTHNSVYKK